LSKLFNCRILPSLPEEYNKDYVIEGGVDYTLLKHSGYSMWHRPYFAMPGSTHKRITLNPHTKYGLDAGKVDAEAISFQEFLKLFDKKSDTYSIPKNKIQSIKSTRGTSPLTVQQPAKT
jgi:hypothetical protein